MSPASAPLPRSIFCLGLGGIGLSALARYFRHKGVRIAGYDRSETPLTQALAAEGMQLAYDPAVLPPSDTDLLIYSPAVKAHPAYDWARQRGIPVRKRAEVLGDISRQYTTLAVAGTHGKTTTTALLAHLLTVAGLSPTALVGGILEGYRTNFLAGTGSLLVVEADEFDRSFLQLDTTFAVVTSAAPDHLDIYGTADAVADAFAAFVGQVRPSGRCWLQEEIFTSLRNSAQCTVENYGFSIGVHNRAAGVRTRGLSTAFEVLTPEGSLGDFLLPMAGLHNVENALAAISVARSLGVPANRLAEGLATFAGIERRFSVQYQSDTCVVVDDYAHHPDEIAAAIAAARSALPGWEVVAVFQPHLYSRTRDFAPGFGITLSAADAVFLADIYPAREEPIPGVSADIIYQQIHTLRKHRVVLNDIPTVLPSFLADRPEQKVVVLLLGAGDISTIVPAVTEALRKVHR